jgi:aspartyl protease family protein
MNLSKVMVGEIELQNVEGAVHDSDFPEVILLGNSFLSRVKMFNDGTLLKLEKK